MKKNWEKVEEHCLEFLEEKFGSSARFSLSGGYDSTTPDIKVETKAGGTFFIEAKSNIAQSGQFVLHPNQEEKTFSFSPQNNSEPSDITEAVCSHMGKSYEKFASAGTRGERVEVEGLENWIKDSYLSKNVKFVIASNGKNCTLIPTEKIDEYFNIFAKYRIKKSGSSKLPKKLVGQAIERVSESHPNAEFFMKDKKLFAKNVKSNQKLETKQGAIFLSPKEENVCEVRKLSKTENMNVIFSVKLKKEQEKEDIDQFENLLKEEKKS